MDNRKLVRYSIIKDSLKDMLINAKYNDEQRVILIQYELRGTLRYMYITGDITKETRERIEHLSFLILQKYNIKK